MASVEFEQPDLEQDPYLLWWDNTLPLGHEVSGSESLEERARNLADLQIAVQRLIDSEAPDDQYKVRSINRRFKVDNTDSEGQQNSLADYPDGILYWLANSTHDDLDLFCNWNTDRHHQQQAALEAVRGNLQADTTQRVDRLIDLNFFPKSAHTLYESVFDEISLEAIDSFEAGGTNAWGYYLHKVVPVIGISNLFSARKTFEIAAPEMYSTTFHEFTHGLGAAMDRGFLLGIVRPKRSKKRELFNWLEEAYVTHVTQISGAGEISDPGRMSPLESTGGADGPYLLEREFLAVLMNNGKRPISLEQLSDAFFEGRTYPRNAVARDSLLRKLSYNFYEVLPEYGDDAIHHFSAEYSRQKSSLRREKLMNGVMTKILERQGIAVMFEDEVPSDQPFMELVTIAATDGSESKIERKP